MKKAKAKKLLTALFAAVSLWVNAQSCPSNSCNVPSCEYVCNGGFTSYSQKPDNYMQIERACGFSSAPNTSHKPEFFWSTSPSAIVQIPCNDFGNQSFNLDDGYVGFLGQALANATSAKNSALQTELKTQLSPGTYEITFYMSLADEYEYHAKNCFGVQLTNGTSSSTFLQYPVDPTLSTNSVTTNGWTKITIIHNSLGGEDVLRIGFLQPPTIADLVWSNSWTSCNGTFHGQNGVYYYVDNVSLKLINPITATASQTTGCIGEIFTLSANGASSYNWQPGNLSGASVNVSPSLPTIYTVTGSSFGGCSSTQATVAIYPTTCCTNSNTGNITLKNATLVPIGSAGTPWISLIPGNIYSGNIVVPSGTNPTLTNTLTIWGGLTINTPVTFSNCNISLNDGVNINQNNPVTISKSWLYGCQNMWGGIQSKAQLSIADSYIEDAYWGVNAGFFLGVGTHPGLFIDNVVFNKNYYSIMAGTCNMIPSNLQIHGCVFTCRRITVAQHVFTSVRYNTYYNLPGIPPTTLLPTITNSISANTKRSNIGVYFNNLITSNGNLFPIGDVNSNPTINANITNKFDNLNIGIHNQGTKVRIYNNCFSHMLTSSLGTALGAVYHDDGVFNTNNTISQIGNIGGAVPNSHYKNIFGFGTSQSTLVDGVTAVNGGSLNVVNNDFNTISRYGVNVKTWGAINVNNEPVLVSNNSFSTTAYAFYGFNNNGIIATITSNTLVQSLATYTNFSNIYIDEVNKNPNSTYLINSNNLRGSLNGVFVQNAQNVSMDNNFIQIKKPTTTSVFNGAIWLNNSQNIHAGNNILSCSPTNANSWNTYGFFANTSQNLSIKCNSITAVSACLKFQQDCRPTTIVTNTLNNNPADPCLYGLWLDNSGKTGSIGYYTGVNWQMSDNVWGDFLATGADSYAQNNSNTDNGVIYIDPIKMPSLYHPTINGAATGGIAFINVSSTINNTQGCGGQQLISPPGGDDARILNNNSSKNNKGLFYSQINTSDGLRTENCLNEISFYKIKDLFEAYRRTGSVEVLNEANQINNSLQPSTNQEYNLKSFNTIYALFLKNSDLVTSDQVNELEKIASLCALTEGVAVYEARGLIRNWDDKTVYFNECENTLPIQFSKSTGIDSGNELNRSLNEIFQIYPNPNNGKFVIENNTKGKFNYTILDLHGRVIKEFDVIDEKANVDLSEFDKGIYFIKTTFNGKTEVKKVIVQ